MDITLFRSQLRSLDAGRLDDLRAFLAYRGLDTKKAAELLQLLLSDHPVTSDREAADALQVKYGSFRNCKAELVGTVLEWRVLHADNWLAPAMRHLLRAHTLMQWGEPKEAYQLATKVQKQMELKGRYAMARISLELQTALVQRVFPDRASTALRGLTGEMNRLDEDRERLKACTDLYVAIVTLANSSSLLRTEDSVTEYQRLRSEMENLKKSYSDIAFPAWAYRVQAEALLHLFEGDKDAAFLCFKALWERMDTEPRPIEPSEHRFYMFFQSYISMALYAGHYQEAAKANALYGNTIRQHFAANGSLLALHQTFKVLAGLKGEASTTDALNELLVNIRKKVFIKGADFDLMHWDLHISCSVLLILARAAYEQGVFEEGIRTLEYVSKQIKAKNTSAATDLQTLAPIIGLVLTVEQYSNSWKGLLLDAAFGRVSVQNYNLFRRQQDRFPIEWELSRLMYGIASGKKDVTILFRKAADRFEQLRQTCHYYKALMMLFDFEGWVNRHAYPTER